MMTRRSWSVVASLAIASLVIPGLARSASAAELPAPTGADLKRVEGEVARLQQEVAEQRQLILQLMQMHDALLRYMQTSGAGAPPPSAAQPGATLPSTGQAPAPALEIPGAAPETAAVTGRVLVDGAAPVEAYVYLDGSRAVPSHPPTVEIKQENRRFIPAVAVVPVGARVLFPNHDTVFHSVFSNTPGDAFDVGTLKAGQTPTPVALLKPGHVEVFCNIHSTMRADVLVVPNVHWTRVRPDGTFHLPGIPAGSRRFTVWGPALKPVSEMVDVKPGGSATTFTTQKSSFGPHLNKNGGAYGSYEN